MNHGGSINTVVSVPENVKLALYLSWEVIWAERERDCSSGVAALGHRGLQERLCRALGRAVSSLASARHPCDCLLALRWRSLPLSPMPSLLST